MRVEVIHHALSVRSSKPLVVRGGLARTFGGLAGFLVVTLSLRWDLHHRGRLRQSPRGRRRGVD